MRSRTMVALPLLMLMLSPFGKAQLWKPILSPGQAIDWSSAGVGGIPARNTKCAIVFPGVKRLMDEFEIVSAETLGTTVTVKKWKH
jgi:hypothetical protein